MNIITKYQFNKIRMTSLYVLYLAYASVYMVCIIPFNLAQLKKTFNIKYSWQCVCLCIHGMYYSIHSFFIIDRFELSSHYISYWKLFWPISYRKNTLLKGAPNSCWSSRGLNSHRWQRCSNKPRTLPLCCWAGITYECTFMSWMQ